MSAVHWFYDYDPCLAVAGLGGVECLKLKFGLNNPTFELESESRCPTITMTKSLLQ
jgi:hypothetical protein